MQNEPADTAERIRTVRIARGLKQAEIDNLAGLPISSTSKIERNMREATASELVRIAQALGMTLDTLLSGKSAFVYQEEIKVIEALREIPFDDYKQILRTLEAQVYFSAKDAKPPLKDHLIDLVSELTRLSQSDIRPRSDFAERKRVRGS
jgi:transcriptional regulator with XRE-family HTH domain